VKENLLDIEQPMKKYILPVLLISVFVCSCVATPPPFNERQWRAAVEKQETEMLYAPHFENGAYFNPWLPMTEKSFGTFLKWRFSKKAPYTEPEETYLPEVQPDLGSRIKAKSAENFIAWIGHATFLIRINGVFWLTDPILSDRALLPKRYTPPALTREELSGLTDPVNVLISHNHYDHLDKPTLQALPPHARVFVPMGLKTYVQDGFKGRVTELDWWENIELDDRTQLVSLPTQHWSRRIGQGFNTTLWASYLLITSETTVFYGGDSGYFVGYREFGRRFPGIDYALIPLTAYHPRWFMHYAHMNAPESIQAFQDLGAQYYIPTQWGTFRLGDNPPGYPLLDLKRTIAAENYDASRFIFMDIGQIEIFRHSDQGA
jgi:L-ascorbate metabolism protein UlaG (beta-lactamase superfamily)